MNERIRELAIQAGHRYYPSSNNGPLRVEYLTPELEKFAQLIAEDCAKMLDEDSYIMPELGGYAHDIRTRYGVK
jgi:hypothetical protein